MRDSNNVFHLAIPCRDLDQAEAFYTGVIGACAARRYDDRVTFDFFGDQLVCHLSPADTPVDAKLYPRHFGITFRRREDFDAVVQRLQQRPHCLLAPVATRFAGRREEHLYLFLKDPSNNVLEFKWYADPAMMY